MSRFRLRRPYDRLFGPVYVPSFFMATGQEAMLILLPLYVLDIGRDAAFAALIVGLRGVGILLFDVPAGMLVTRFGDRPVLLGGVAAVLAGMLLLATSESTIFIAAAAILLGCGFSAWMLGRQSYVSDVCETQETGRAIAVMAGVQRGGAFVGPALGGAVALAWGYSAAFLAGAGAALVAVIFVLRYAADVRPEAASADHGVSGTMRIVREERRVFATAGLAALTLQLMRASRQLLVPLFGAAVGLDVAAIGIIYSFSAVIDMCLFYPVGILVDRRGRKWSAVPAMSLFVIGLVLLPWTEGLYSLVTVALLLGLANGLGTGIVMILGADLSRASRQRSQFLGVWRLICDTGVSSAPFLTSALIGLASLATASLTIAGVGVVGTVLMAFFTTETLRLTRN